MKNHHFLTSSTFELVFTYECFDLVDIDANIESTIS